MILFKISLWLIFLKVDNEVINLKEDYVIIYKFVLYEKILFSYKFIQSFILMFHQGNFQED